MTEEQQDFTQGIAQEVNTQPKDVPQEAEAQPQDKKNKARAPFIVALAAVVVVALAAVLFVVIPNSAEEDPDKAIVNLINENAKGSAKNSYEGYMKAKNIGYVLDDLLLSKESRAILWDSVNDCFVLAEGDEVIYAPVENPASGTDLWIFVSEIPQSSKYSVYWVGTYESTVTVNVNGEDVPQSRYHSAHVYQVTKSGNTQTYSCENTDCTLSYTVSVK